MNDSGVQEWVVRWSDPQSAAAEGLALSGLDYLRAMRDGRIPPPPIMALLGANMAEVEPGRVRMTLVPRGFHYNPLATVHGGVIATLLDSVMGCSVHSTLPAGTGYTTLEFKVNFLRAVTEATGLVTAEGQIVHGGRRSAVAEARLTDANDKLVATASTTCLILQGAGGAG